jgi:hypothetical protein
VTRSFEINYRLVTIPRLPSLAPPLSKHSLSALITKQYGALRGQIEVRVGAGATPSWRTAAPAAAALVAPAPHLTQNPGASVTDAAQIQG